MAALRGLPRREMKVLGRRRVRMGQREQAAIAIVSVFVKKKGDGGRCAPKMAFTSGQDDAGEVSESVRNLECRVAQNRFERVAVADESREPLL